MSMETTLVYVINGNKVLLKKATRGISVGKWNGLGGKIEEGETPETSARREAFEESGLTVERLYYHGMMSHYLDGGKEKPTVKVHLFSTRHFSGKIKESSEGELRWFDVDKLPLGEMWEDDKYWAREAISGHSFDASFYYDIGNKAILRYHMSPRNAEPGLQ